MSYCISVNRRSLLLSLPCLLTALVWNASCFPPPAHADDAFSDPPYASWGEQTMTLIQPRFWLPETKLYSEFALQPDGRAWRGSHPAFMWGVGVQLSALNAAAKVQPEKYLLQAQQYAGAIGVYWLKANGIEGYDVQPGPKDSDRYYDDNAWLVLALIELSEVSQERQYLEQAIATFQFVMSGEDDKLDGGLYWREKELTSKNTCTNAPAIVSALRLYQATDEEHYLQTAQRLSNWTVDTLQDEDGLFWDNIRMDGRVDRRKFSYNSALMIRANVLFAEITHQEKYAAEARRIANAANQHWIADDGAIRDSGRFAHLLLESFLELASFEAKSDPDTASKKWEAIVKSCLAYLHHEVRNEDGWYGHRWDEAKKRSRWRIALIDQASAARAYWLAAKYF